MEKERGINYITFLLSWIAGFCDVATYVSGNHIFSAHVTGNFITFGADIVSNNDGSSWVKLLTFPVFIIGVILGGYISNRSQKNFKILYWESIILILTAVISFLLARFGWLNVEVGMYTVVLLTVLAMGLQNAFGKVSAKETHGPTTMMTGNVTQAALNLGGLLLGKLDKKPANIISLKKQYFTIGGFLVGCVSGAILAKEFGLVVLAVPGIVLLFSHVTGTKKHQLNPD